MQRLDGLLSARRETVRRTLDACDALAAGPDESAAAEVHRNASELLAELRAPERGADTLTTLATRLDDAVRSDGPELLDLDVVPRAVKSVTMRLLHRTNAAVGSYDTWTAAVRSALGARGSAHLYDLGAGTGGYARHLAKHPPAGLALRVTSSDLEPAYVAAGERAALDEGLRGITWEVCDALDLRALRERADVDLFLCTQAAHHLPPGMLVRMISEAVRSAPGGLLVVDLSRSVATALATAAVTSIVAPWPLLVYDGFQSVRRAYTPAEFALLARLAGATRVDAKPFGPAWCSLHARR